MLKVHIEKIADVAVVQCEGRIVHSDAAFKLRDAITQQGDSRAVLLDLSEVESIEGGGLGMLMFLHRWCRDHGIRLKLFDFPGRVRRRLERAGSTAEFEIARTDEVMSLLGWEGRPNCVTASQEGQDRAIPF